MEDIRRRERKMNRGKSEGELKHERPWTLEKQTEGFGGERGEGLGDPGGGYHGGHVLHEALGVVHKQ